MTTFSAPAMSPAYLGVGYIIGPRLAALNFAGGVFAWGLLVPLLIFFLGPQLQRLRPPGPPAAWGGRGRRHLVHTSCGPSRWAACWWARPTRCSACARTWASA